VISRLLVLSITALLAVAGQATELKLTYVNASNAALGNPHDLKLSPDGNYLFVADVDNDRIAILDPDSLALVAEFGSDHQKGTHDVDFDARGRAYVADTHNNRITIYDVDGTRAELVGELGERIRGPEGVLAHPNGKIYVAGAWSGNVVVYDNGEIVDELSGLSSPHDLELARNGDVWLAEAGASRILLLSPELEIKRELGRSKYDFNGVRYLHLTPDGILIALPPRVSNCGVTNSGYPTRVMIEWLNIPWRSSSFREVGLLLCPLFMIRFDRPSCPLMYIQCSEMYGNRVSAMLKKAVSVYPIFHCHVFNHLADWYGERKNNQYSRRSGPEKKGQEAC
jgi:hypothetical protein